MINLSDPTAGDEVWIYAGTYKPQHTATNWRYDPDDPANDNYPYTPGERENSFVLKRGVKIYGGFDSEVAGATVPPFGAAGRNGTSTLSGDLDNSGTRNSGDASHVVVGADIPDGGATVLDGFTVSGGYANASGSIAVNTRTVSGYSGGGIYNSYSSPVLTHVTISENEATSGGGIHNNDDSSPVLTHVTISRNKAHNSNGGGMFNSSSSPVLTHVTISENSAAIGGGISNGMSFPRLTHVTISGNTARIGGGGIHNYKSSPILTNVTISGNTDIQKGGGIYNESNSRPELTNVTVSGNWANGNGDGIYNENYSSPELTNTVVWGNNTNVSNDGTSTPVYKNSLVQGATSADANGNLDGANDPLFVSLEAATSSTPTTGGDYRLQDGSPLIDKGDDAAYLTARSLSDFTGETDLAGLPRHHDAAIDIGAYEYMPPYTVASAPQDFTAMPSNAQVTLSWKDPDDDGGTAITGYEISIDGGDWVAVPELKTDTVITGLTNGTPYSFQVRAINAAGEGPATAGISATPRTVPTVPQDPSAAPDNMQVTLTWNTPADDGGTPITGYEISIDGGGWVAVPELKTDTVITGLTNGTPYSFQVRAINAAGEGEATAGIPATPRTVPTVPQDPIAAPGDMQVTLSWNTPADDGGSPITGYKVSSDGGANWVTAASLTAHTFTGLTNGTPYTFHVRAINAAGEGPAATITATPESYGIILSPPPAFPAETYGYDALAPLTITVTNTGTQPTGPLTATLTGLNPGAFGLSPLTPGTSKPPAITLGSIPTGGSGTFLLAPDFGLNAGTYVATVTVSGANGISANFAVSFTVNRAVPTAAALAFTLSNATFDDRPHPVTVTPATGITGLGAITVRYNGSTAIPVYPGTYTVTIDIAAGDNYAAVTGLPAGTFTISEPPTPVIRRLVTLLPTPGLTTDPPAGPYYINSGTNFTFRLTPDVPSPDGTPPVVQTTRANAPDGSSGIRITPNADGSYTVVILGIRENIKITLSTPTDNAPVADATLTLGTVPGALVIANSRPDAVTVYVYDLAGMLVRLTTVPPGTTRLSVAPGIYIVTDGGAFRRKAAVAR